jgi:hypothetical protein
MSALVAFVGSLVAGQGAAEDPKVVDVPSEIGGVVGYISADVRLYIAGHVEGAGTYVGALQNAIDTQRYASGVATHAIEMPFAVPWRDPIQTTSRRGFTQRDRRIVPEVTDIHVGA